MSRKRRLSIRVVLIGCGTMGSIFLEALLRLVPRRCVTVIERNPTHAQQIRKRYNVPVLSFHKKRGVRAIYDCGKDDLVILAIKPQDRAALPTLIGETAKNSIVLSMMAGIPISVVRTLTHAKRIVRCMPNTPSRVEQGVTIWTTTRNLTSAQQTFIKRLLSSLGMAMYVPSDEWIDRATAISGCGPAYLFTFAEYLVDAAQQLGFSSAMANEIVQRMMYGSTVLWQQSGMSAHALRNQVASKGGTTEAALNVLTEAQMKRIIGKAVRAAYARATALRSSVQENT